MPASLGAISLRLIVAVWAVTVLLRWITKKSALELLSPQLLPVGKRPKSSRRSRFREGRGVRVLCLASANEYMEGIASVVQSTDTVLEVGCQRGE